MSCLMRFNIDTKQCSDCGSTFQNEKVKKCEDRKIRCMGCYKLYKDNLFLEQTKDIIDNNKDLELALSKIDHFDTEEWGCGSLVGQEITDYLEGNCPYTHKKCKYWKEISEDDFDCVLPDSISNGEDPICPHGKRGKNED